MAPASSACRLDSPARMFMVFGLGHAQFAVESHHVRALVCADLPAEVVGQHPHHRGALHLRGRSVPVVDLGSAFGLGDRETSAGAAVLVVATAGRREDEPTGLLVDEILDVVAIRPEHIRPPDGTEPATGYVTGVATANERVVSLLDVDRLLALAH